MAIAGRKFLKEVLRTGTYVKGERQFSFSPDDIRDCQRSLSALHAAGLNSPLLREHTDPAAEGEGTPFFESEQEKRADELKRTVGKIDWSDPRTNQINADGGLDLVFHVPDEATAKQLAAETIEFVSPEIRPYWKSGKGDEFTKLITHVALTHRPIQTDQKRGFVQLSSAEPLSKLSAPLQLSLAELTEPPAASPIQWEKVMPKTAPAKVTPAGRKLLKGHFENFLKQLADDAENDPPKEAESDPLANPDLPDTKEGGAKKQAFEALVAHLKNLGLVLPADTDESNLVDRLLTAAMTKSAAESDKESDDSDGDNNPNAQELNPMQSAQLSDNAARDNLVNRIRGCKSLPQQTRDELLVRVGATQFSDGKEKAAAGALTIEEVLKMFESQAIQFSDGSPQQGLVNRIKALRKTQLPGVCDKLLARVGTIQFSDSGEDLSGTTGFIESLEASGNAVASVLEDRTAGYQMSDVDSLGHPRGSQFFDGQRSLQVGDPKANKAASEMLKRAGIPVVEPNSLSINASEVLK